MTATISPIAPQPVENELTALLAALTKDPDKATALLEKLSKHRVEANAATAEANAKIAELDAKLAQIAAAQADLEERAKTVEKDEKRLEANSKAYETRKTRGREDLAVDRRMFEAEKKAWQGGIEQAEASLAEREEKFEEERRLFVDERAAVQARERELVELTHAAETARERADIVIDRMKGVIKTYGGSA